MDNISTSYDLEVDQAAGFHKNTVFLKNIMLYLYYYYIILHLGRPQI